ncbi:glycosyl transferase [Enterocloster aldenensis]|uniref:glycosyltransferase WbsX family protein n=1 Tax=Enterocloster aldenensis TaxID=358742 RepID=UPI000E51FB94|nr:glycosyl transferase [Enterocloster aldenensis]
MRIIAFYLPQFHSFPENDLWWGKGFTEWTNTQKAIPLFKGHYQPHTPLNEYYYDLSDSTVMRNQIKIAKKYGIYGFCFYHYWFTHGKMLMEKPVEAFLNDKTLNINFCLSWANEHWTRTWDGGSRQIIMEQEYGTEEDWIKHFNYFLPYFLDKRYIYINDMPILIIYRPEIIPCLDEMLSCWKKKAIENGLKGIYMMAQGSMFCMQSHRKKKMDLINGYIMYEPGYTYSSVKLTNGWEWIRNLWEYRYFASNYLPNKIKSKLFNVLKIKTDKPYDICDFSVLWDSILKHNVPENYYPGAFANWDNTARRGLNGRIITGSTPELFRDYISQQIIRARNEYVKDYLFFTAWNEWAEGSHLEPDERYGFQYLEAVKMALLETNEWPFNDNHLLDKELIS